MSPDRWHQLTAIFHAALARDPASRDQFVADACATEPALGEDVRSMLAAHDRVVASGGFSTPWGPTVGEIIPAGTQLGAYRIEERIGTGGQASVYRALDLQIGRTVAIKVLPDGWLDDPARRARFDREARVLASLNEPHIAAIYGLVTEGPRLGLVLEYVDGETLHEAIGGRPLPPTRAMAIARDVAGALEVAHDKGIVHRDLKPANIKIAANARVKVLDFGLARIDARFEGPGDAEAVTIEGTREGLVMGTPAYMSPEQARGQVVDKRSDVWAFGCVLYEMLTGRALFARETLSDTIAAVLEQPIDLAALPATTPASVRTMLGRCLQRDLTKRLRDIGDARIELDDASLATLPKGTPVEPQAVSSWNRRAALAIAGIVLVSAGVALGRYVWTPTGEQAATAAMPVMRLSLDLGDEVRLGSESDFAVSADGDRLVYRAGGRLLVRRMDQTAGSPIPGTQGAGGFFLSPDGGSVAFFANGKLKKVTLDGQLPVDLCDAPAGRGGAWSESGFIVAALGPSQGLSRVSDSGGTPSPVTSLAAGEFTHRYPRLLPGGHAVLFTSHSMAYGFDRAKVEVVSIGTGERTILVREAIAGPYVDGANGTGYLTYLRGGVLYAQEFDPRRLEAGGAALAVLADVGYSPNLAAMRVAVSGRDTLVYGRAPQTRLQLLSETSGSASGFEPAAYSQPTVSAQGRVAYILDNDLWTADVRGGDVRQLTRTRDVTAPVWTRDGRFLMFARAGQGVWWLRADGATAPQAFWPGRQMLQLPTSAGPGGLLGFMQLEPTATVNWDVWIAPVTSDAAALHAGDPAPFLRTAQDERDLAFSPDGRWVAYESTVESGTVLDVFVRSYPDNGRRWQVSTGGGQFPIWSPSTGRLFFMSADRVMAAAYRVRSGEFSADAPRKWSDAPLAAVFNPFAVLPDGKGVLAVTLDPADAVRNRSVDVIAGAAAFIRNQMQSRR